MQILAIETTALTGTLALLRDGEVHHTTSLPDATRSAQSLAPTIQSFLRQHGWLLPSLDLIAVAVGPGSFTGLRIGVTTAKTLAYALGIKIRGIDTLAALACQQPPLPPATRLHAILDAQRNQLFAARLVAGVDEFPVCEAATHIVDLEAWLQLLAPGDVVTGPPVEKLRSMLPGNVVVAPSELLRPHASGVGRLAFRDYQCGVSDDVWRLMPQYFRASAAEEKAAQNALYSRH